MKKLFLLIGLLTMFIFLVSCTDNIAGEAFKFKALQPKCVKEMCDNKDNDCDGIVDDGVKNCCRGVSTPLDTAANCGSCGNVCKSGQSCLNGACVAPTTFSCTGTVPANSTLCTGDDASLSANTVRTTVAACTAGTKCEYACNTGYTLQNGVCVNASPFYCDGNTAINASGTYNCETRYSIASGQPLICREVIMNGLTTGRCGENCTAGSRSILCSYYSGTYHYTNYLCSSYRIWNQENSVSSCSTGQTCTANSTRNGICS